MNGTCHNCHTLMEEDQEFHGFGWYIVYDNV